MTVLAPLVQHHSLNYSTRHGERVRLLVWHSTIGSYAGSVSWLCNPAAQASAHLVVREDGGEVSQLVKLAEKAWHAVQVNAYSVGVEHASMSQGFHGPAQERESARIFAWLCHRYGIPPLDGTHSLRGIVRHRSLGAMGGGHSDGPTDREWHRFLGMVHAELERGGFRKTWAR